VTAHNLILHKGRPMKPSLNERAASFSAIEAANMSVLEPTTSSQLL
jgi:hypothetical protein